MSKNEEVNGVVERRALQAIDTLCAGLSDRIVAEAIRQNRRDLAFAVAWEVTGDEYHMLELFDIFGWKRQRVRR